MSFQDPLQAQLIPFVVEAFKEAFGAEIDPQALQFQLTRPEFEGDLTINVFPFLKASGKGPEPTATAVGAHLETHAPMVERYNVVKGFLNLVIGNAYWLGFLAEHQAKGVLQFPPNGRHVMVEFSSPNTNKPLHLGHLRNIFLGHSVSRLLQQVGCNVVKAQIINDRGIHICKSMLAWQRLGNGETPESSGIKGDKLVGKYYVRFDQELKKQVADRVASGIEEEVAAKEAPLMLEAQEMLRQWEANDPQVRALWSKMNSWVYDGFNITYQRLNVSFDKLYYESDTSDLGREHVMEGLKKGVFFQKEDGSIWCDLTEDGLDQKLLLRSDGTAVYITQDIGTAILRFADYPKLEQLIYTVGNEQDYHFKVLFLILKKLGYAWAEGLHHLSYGMVDLPSGKMKSREGTVVDADDIIDEMEATARENAEELGKTDEMSTGEADRLHHMVGMGALKYFLLKVDPKKRLLFDPAASIDLNGHTGPFIQYTHARIRSLLDKAEPDEVERALPADVEISDSERSITLLLHQFPGVMHHSAHAMEPSAVANHAYELAKSYNTFYQTIPVLKEVDGGLRAFRLGLSRLVANTLREAMWTLGIEVPDRM